MKDDGVSEVGISSREGSEEVGDRLQDGWGIVEISGTCDQ